MCEKSVVAKMEGGHRGRTTHRDCAPGAHGIQPTARQGAGAISRAVRSSSTASNACAPRQAWRSFSPLPRVLKTTAWRRLASGSASWRFGARRRCARTIRPGRVHAGSAAGDPCDGGQSRRRSRRAAPQLEHLLRAGADHVAESGLPYGAAVEAMAADALMLSAELATDSYDREHVTPFLRRDSRFFAVEEFAARAADPAGASSDGRYGRRSPLHAPALRGSRGAPGLPRRSRS